MGPGHPEQPARLHAIEKSLSAECFASLKWISAPKAPQESLLRVHPQSYLDALNQASPTQGYAPLDSDTQMNPYSLAAIWRAAGGAVSAVDHVLSGETDNAFVATRPPGHHASITNPMGFCFINNAAIAARHAQAAYGLERIAIIDFDVHHGNGTQDIFWSDNSVLFCSTHQAPFYPGTGGQNETGDHNTIVNAPLFAGASGEAFKEALSQRILPRVEGFRPDLILISAGFDAHADDPLGGLMLSADDFSDATKRIMEVADRRSKGRIVSMLEGGYNLQALGLCVSGHVRALMGI
jgi:acetoin utilization deacetylase AcuC-like enzyme